MSNPYFTVSDEAEELRAEVKRLRELLAQSKGSLRLLAEELEGGSDPRDIAARLHAGADYISARLTGSFLDTREQQ